MGTEVYSLHFQCNGQLKYNIIKILICMYVVDLLSVFTFTNDSLHACAACLTGVYVYIYIIEFQPYSIKS